MDSDGYHVFFLPIFYLSCVDFIITLCLCVCKISRYWVILIRTSPQDFEKEEKKKFVEEADAEYKAFLNDPITKFSVPSELTEQRKEALKHWENLCSMVDAEEQAEEVSCWDGIVIRAKPAILGKDTTYVRTQPACTLLVYECSVKDYWIGILTEA